MLKPHGYATFAVPDASNPTEQFDAIRCGHCQQIILTKPHSAATVYLCKDIKQWVDHRGPHFEIVTTEEPGAGCYVCQRAVCLRCHADGRCTPFERQLEASEAAWRKRKAAGLA